VAVPGQGDGAILPFPTGAIRATGTSNDDMRKGNLPAGGFGFTQERIIDGLPSGAGMQGALQQ
jgi:hypothetical protein